MFLLPPPSELSLPGRGRPVTWRGTRCVSKQPLSLAPVFPPNRQRSSLLPPMGGIESFQNLRCPPLLPEYRRALCESPCRQVPQSLKCFFSRFPLRSHNPFCCWIGVRRVSTSLILGEGFFDLPGISLLRHSYLFLAFPPSHVFSDEQSLPPTGRP